MVGSLSGATWSRVKYVAIVGIITVAVILLFAKELDVLLLGDDVAETLGVDTRKTKLLIIITATILTGVVVSVSGVIGFVGSGRTAYYAKLCGLRPQTADPCSHSGWRTVQYGSRSDLSNYYRP